VAVSHRVVPHSAGSGARRLGGAERLPLVLPAWRAGRESNARRRSFCELSGVDGCRPQR
jgi:hypothetical protein